MTPVPTMAIGPVTVYFGDRTGKYPDGNQVVIRGRDCMAAFDTPLVANRLKAQLHDVDLVILGHAHEDHMAGLHFLDRARIAAPEADLDAVRTWDGLARHYGYARPGALDEMRAKIERDFFYMPRPDASGYPDGHRWDLGGVSVRSVLMPGHTAGHSVLVIEPGEIAFIGDIDLTGFGPYYGDACSSLQSFRRTIAHLERLPARTWITSHHKGVITERAVFLELLRAFAEKIERRAQAILRALEQRPRTLDELVEQRFIYPPGYQDVYIEDAERTSIREHLDELIAHGRVVDDEGIYRSARSRVSG